MKTTQKKKLRKLLNKWGVEDTVREVVKVKEVLKQVVPQEKLGQLFDSLSKISQSINSSKEFTDKELSELSTQLNQIKSDADGIARDLKETKDGLLKKEDFDTTELETRINEEIKKLRLELLRYAARNGGGAMNQRISVNSSVMSRRYADINLKGTITATDNNTTKEVDIDLSGLGSVTSVSNSDGTLTVSPTTGSIVASRAAITGDISVPVGSNISTLASVLTAGGPTGSATVTPIITYDAKGRLTAVSSATTASFSWFIG